MNNRRVSIIIRTTAKRAKFLDEALFSVLGSYYPNIEVVLVVQTTNDRAYQDIVALSQLYTRLGMTIQLVRNATDEDKRSQNLNLGLAQATGRYVGFLDDDDVLYPEHISLLVETLEQSPSTAWAYADVIGVLGGCDALEQFYVKSHDRNMFKKEKFSFGALWKCNHIPILSFLIDRERVNPVYLQFNESFRVLEDYNFLLRLSLFYEPKYLPKVTSEYRFRLDGTNSSYLVENLLGIEATTKQKIWDEAENQVEAFRQKLLMNSDSICNNELNTDTNIMSVTQRNFQREYIHLNIALEQREYLQLNTELSNAHGRIAAMETSKFWKLRSMWFKLRRFVGIKGE
jgi:glycosyltransferase involved in cell wall biosynthesis